MHLALIGDSVFDNRSYTNGAPDVASHLRDVLGEWKVTLLAIDGSTTNDLGRQFDRVAKTVTHLVVSVGGNDALMNADLLDLPVKSTAEALDLFQERLDAFEASYGHVVEALAAFKRETTVCTIYNGNLGGDQARRARTALTMFNDVILRSALRAGFRAIDLRLVCDELEDFANPIEPSGTGGRKIAESIARAIGAAGEWHRKTILTAG